MRRATNRTRETPGQPAKPRQGATAAKQQKANPIEQTRKGKTPARFKYDVCVSFAGETREVVKAVVSSLKRRHIKCFYDFDEQANLVGKDLVAFLDDVYRKNARFCIMFISEHYPVKQWTNHERKSIQARVLESKDDYLIPVRLDDTEVPGVLPTMGYIDGRSCTASEIAALIQTKVRGKGARKQAAKKPRVAPAGRKVVWTHLTSLRKLRRALNNPIAMALLDLTAARPGQKMMFSEVLRHAGVTEARQGMIALGVLTKTIKREFNLPSEKVTWPVERHASTEGKISYWMSPEVAQAWLNSAQAA